MAKCNNCVHYAVCVRLGKPALYGIDKGFGCDQYLEVVPCKECKHWSTPHIGSVHWCDYAMMGKCTKPDDFCSCGERREGE